VLWKSVRNMVPTKVVQQIAVLLRVSPEYLRWAMNRSAGNVCVVSPQIANYPCLIAIHGDNSNIGPFLLSLWRVLFQYYLACMSLWILEKLIAFLFANRAATIGIGIVGSKWKYSVCVLYNSPPYLHRHHPSVNIKSRCQKSPPLHSRWQHHSHCRRWSEVNWTCKLLVQVRQEGQKGWREIGSSLSHNNNFVLIPMYAGLDLCLTNQSLFTLSSPTRQRTIEDGITTRWSVSAVL